MNTREAKRYLDDVIKSWLHINANSTKPERMTTIYLEGVPGLSKTSMCEAAAETIAKLTKTNKVNTFTLPLAQLGNEAAELLGSIVTYFEFRDEVSGKKIWLAKEIVTNTEIMSVHYAGYRPTGETSTRNAPPEWLAHLQSTKYSILILDDIKRAQQSLMNAVMEIINKGSFGNYTLPNNCIVLCTGNDEESSAAVSQTEDAHSTRYIKVDVTNIDIDHWSETYAEDNLSPTTYTYFVKNWNIEGVQLKQNIRAVTRFCKVVEVAAEDLVHLMNGRLSECVVFTEGSTKDRIAKAKSFIKTTAKHILANSPDEVPDKNGNTSGTTVAVRFIQFLESDFFKNMVPISRYGDADFITDLKKEFAQDSVKQFFQLRRIFGYLKKNEDVVNKYGAEYVARVACAFSPTTLVAIKRLYLNKTDDANAAFRIVQSSPEVKAIFNEYELSTTK